MEPKKRIKPKEHLFHFMEETSRKLRDTGKARTSETYHAALVSFARFRNGKDITFEEIDEEVVAAYESSLKESGLSPNTTSFYMRILRATYNRAVNLGLAREAKPFRNVYTGIARTRKRGIDMAAMKRLADLDLDEGRTPALARDMFMFSFYTRGMSFVDMAYLKKKDLNRGVLTYRRRKTGQLMYIRWEKCMEGIASKYEDPGSPYILPIIRQPYTDERKQYIRMSHKINRSLKSLGRKAGIDTPLTMYVARHTWACAARKSNIPLSVISEGMGHTSEMTTRIYLSALDADIIDNANRKIIKLL